MNLQDFATRTKQAAANTPATGRFGDNKAFIHAVWAIGRFAYAGMSLEAFKTQLWAACQSGLVELSRADMVEAMDPRDVRLSNMHVLGATFNFVRI